MSKLKALILVAAGFSSAAFADEPSVPLSPAPTTASAAAPANSPDQAGGAVPLTKSDVDTWLDGFLPYALRTADIPGAVVTVVKDGQLLTARGYGFADREKRTPVDPDRTLFRPGSVSKLVTWTAAMQLVEQGKLDLDKDVNTYLDFKIPEYDGKPVTLRQIMTHTAGFEEAVKDIIFTDPAHLLPLGEYLKRWTPKRVFEPGTTPAYSNWATALTGYLVERVSGESFDDYCDKHIFAPLGMTNSTMRQPLPAALAGQMASGYKPGQEAGKFEIIGPAPAGSLSATGTDMAKFMIANLDGGKGLLSPEVAATMYNPPLDKFNPVSLLPPLNRMRLGYFETNVNGREVIGHLGDTEFFHTSLHLLMKEGVGIYFSFNSGGREGQVQTLRWSLFEDFADRYFPATAAADAPLDAKTAAEHAAMMAGNWQVSRTAWSNPIAVLNLIGQTKVAVGPKGGLLIPDLLGANKLPREWEEIAPFVWREKGGHDLLAAQVKEGQVVRWSFGLLAPFMVFDRVPAHRSSSWITPVASISLGVLLLTVLFWPIGWFARRKYRATFPLAGTALRAYKWTRWASLAVVLVLVGWMAMIGALFANLENLAGAFDALLWVLQIVGLVAFIGAVAIAGWNAWLTWRDGRRWTAKTWNTLIAVSSVVLLYVAFNFNLLSMTVNY
ncbi:MAG TPA: serine hydrolase [Steroidobacteraceae bacterium]|nr:serine hydrolase [Steroidobacteraceae bacterium]